MAGINVPLVGEDEVESAFPGAKPIEVLLGEDNITANPPVAGLLMLVMAAQGEGSDGLDSASAVIDLLQHIFDEDDYATLRDLIATGRITPEALTDMVLDLIGMWSEHPTQEPSDSSPLPSTTGPKSTAKRRSKARTPASSR